MSVALAAAPAVATGLFVLMPDRWGAALLGDTWTGAHAVLVAVGAQLVATGVLGGALLGLQTLGRTRSSFAASLLQAPFTLVLGVGGLFVAGPVGAATGFALAHCIAPVTCWLLLVRHRRRAGGRLLPSSEPHHVSSLTRADHSPAHAAGMRCRRRFRQRPP